jgi:hypothetical protein
MMWKTRTRTKIMTIALIMVAIWVSVVVGAWAVKGTTGAPEMVVALLATGGVSFCTFLWSIMRENIRGGRKDDKHDQH